jgi:hypothetical protein
MNADGNVPTLGSRRTGPQTSCDIVFCYQETSTAWGTSKSTLKVRWLWSTL